ncbi:Seg-like homing endonuclease protein [Rhizobium phage RHph_TM3_3_14B]|nr:Seg-like homing endonuclease protein [Rhizobium phage RHph_TM3_3_14B]
MEHYTYVWRDSSGVPFYVGKGTGRRAWSTTQRSKEFKAVQSQGGCSVEIVDYFIHESQAHAHEVELIKLYGRREFGGSLVNKTDGGEGASGFVHTAETRAKISASLVGRAGIMGRLHSEVTRRKIAEAKRGKPRSEETRAKLSAAASGKTLSAETKAKMSSVRLGRKHGKDARSKMSAANAASPPRDKNKSGFKGVYPQDGKWRVQFYVDGKRMRLGMFSTAEEAARAYDKEVFRIWGMNCYLNFPADLVAA